MLNSLTSNAPRNRCQPEAVLRKVLAAMIMCAVVIVLGTGSLFGIWTTLTAFRPEGQEVQRESIATSAAILGTAFFLLVITAGTLVRVGLLPKPNRDPATWSAGADTGQ